MYIDFDKINSSAKLWVYQGDRKFTETEEQQINDYLKTFTESWSAHGKPLLCSGKIFYHQFVVLAVDESMNLASGCSIDSSVGFIRNLEQKLGINFLDRSKIAFLDESEILIEQFANIKSKVASGIIKEDTLTFNNVVASKAEFDQSWILPAKESWMKRFF
jgi:hypothetical protein